MLAALAMVSGVWLRIKRERERENGSRIWDLFNQSTRDRHLFGKNIASFPHFPSFPLISSHFPSFPHPGVFHPRTSLADLSHLDVFFSTYTYVQPTHAFSSVCLTYASYLRVLTHLYPRVLSTHFTCTFHPCALPAYFSRVFLTGLTL